MEFKKCEDWYGEVLRLGDEIVPIHQDQNQKGGQIIEIDDTRKFVTIKTSDGQLIKKINAVSYTTLERLKSEKITDFIYDTGRLKKVVQLDMKKGEHIYIGYNDIDGIPIAERMVLLEAFPQDKKIRRKYYVAKNEQTGEYYLQSFHDTLLIGAYNHKKREYNPEIAQSRTERIENVNKMFEVYADCGKYKVYFLEDLGIGKDNFPPIIKIVDGKKHTSKNNTKNND